MKTKNLKYLLWVLVLGVSLYFFVANKVLAQSNCDCSEIYPEWTFCWSECYWDLWDYGDWWTVPSWWVNQWNWWNNAWWSNESCDCTVLPLSEDCYMECNSQWNNGWWNNTCHHLLQSWWTCELWYREWTASDGSACCVLVCESGSLSWDANWDYICESCIPGETIPNESHTRCICDPNFKCCWVQLNNVIPFIWDCIEMNAESNRDNTTNVNSVTAFPILMQWLMKILMSVIMIFSFLMIIVAWLMIVSWAFGWNWFATGKKIIKNVIISLILLWCSWLILSLINPSFFGG